MRPEPRGDVDCFEASGGNGLERGGVRHAVELNICRASARHEVLSVSIDPAVIGLST